MARITSLQVENVMRLKAVYIEPGGSLTIIGGANGAGKTCVLNSISMALGGKKEIPDKPLRDGAKKGKVVVELDNGLTITRTFTPAGSNLKVEDKIGKVKSPQAILHKLVGPISFDPLAFSRMSSKEQVETLKALVGLDFTDLDGKRQSAYDERTAVNRELKGAEARVDAMPSHEGAPAEPESISELLAEVEKRNAVNADNDALRNRLDEAREQANAVKAEMDEMKVKLLAREKELFALVDAGKAMALEVGELEDADTNEIKERLATVEETNIKARENQELEKAVFALEPLKIQTDELTEIIKRIDKEKAEALAGADFPVEGLAFDADGVTYNGLPFDQASGAEGLRVSVAMGIALNPTLPVMLVRDGSLLDEDSLRMVADMAEEAGAQVWLERVGEGQECSVIIEEGEVKGK